jgi:hypothetical protein
MRPVPNARLAQRATSPIPPDDSRTPPYLFDVSVHVSAPLKVFGFDVNPYQHPQRSRRFHFTNRAAANDPCRAEGESWIDCVDNILCKYLVLVKYVASQKEESRPPDSANSRS